MASRPEIDLLLKHRKPRKIRATSPQTKGWNGNHLEMPGPWAGNGELLLSKPAVVPGGQEAFKSLAEVPGMRRAYMGGLSFPVRLLAVSSLGLFAGWWFYAKLGIDYVYVPFHGDVHLGGLLFILFFVIVTLATFSTGVIDGVDGLSGGVMSAVFTAYGMIAYANGQVNLAAFCFVVVGGIMAFLWFNIPPALFYLTETGMLSLSLSLSVVAFLTNAVAYLPIIALPLLATTASVILQLTWKKIFKKKLFLVAPMHHHFQALGWPSYKVTMRYWIVSYICAMLGVIIALVG
jgi:phospho-N-acetylmuramoyl-pentapeptide-transferase